MLLKIVGMISKKLIKYFGVFYIFGVILNISDKLQKNKKKRNKK